MSRPAERPLRLVFIGDASSYHVSKWVRFFGAAGHQVHVISTGPAEIPDVSVHWIRNPFRVAGLRHAFYGWYAVQVLTLLRQLKPDAVHVLQINLYAFLATLAGAQPLIATPFGGDVLVRPRESAWARRMVQYVLRRAHLVVCDADHIVPVLRKLGRATQDVELVYFGVDVDRFTTREPSEHWRRRLAVEEARVVFSLRHLMPVYDIATLVRAVPLVVSTRPDVRFVVVGKGPEEPRLRRLVSELGVEEYVRFPGWIDGADLPAALSIAAVYVSTSTSDAGLASSTGEAMACGVPPVVTDFGDNGLWIRDGENGYLFPIGDERALATAVGRILDDTSLRAKFGERARQEIVQRYNWTTEMRRMERLYHRVTAAQRASD